MFMILWSILVDVSLLCVFVCARFFLYTFFLKLFPMCWLCLPLGDDDDSLRLFIGDSVALSPVSTTLFHIRFLLQYTQYYQMYIKIILSKMAKKGIKSQSLTLLCTIIRSCFNHL
jgi:hypothetical protein